MNNTPNASNSGSVRMPRVLAGGGHGRNLMAGPKPKNFKQSLWRLLGYFKPHARMLAVIVTINIVATVCNNLGPRFLGYATNEIARGVMSALNGEGAPVDLQALKSIIGMLAGIYLTSSALRYLDNFVLAGIVQRTMYSLRRTIDEKLDQLPLEYYDQKAHGDILSRVTNDVDTISNSVHQCLTQVINSLISVVTIITVMLFISPLLTLIAMVTLPAGMFAAGWIIKHSQKYFRGQQNALGQLGGFIEEMYAGHNVIKAFGREQSSTDTFSDINCGLYGFAWKAQFATGVMMPIVGFLTNLGYVGVSVAGAVLVIRQSLQIGDIQAFVMYLRNFSHPIANLASVANTIQSAVAAAERIFELLDEKEQSSEPALPVCLENTRGEVDFSHVRFAYQPDVELIRDLSAHIRSGASVAIVGPTGAGKTTLVNLLLRFYDIQGGAILIDGVDIAGMERSQLRSHFGVVLQDAWLFTGSIRENIRYGRLDATDEEVVAAARAAYADHFIRQLPGGYDFELTEDASNISQGQRQLLTIARAILSDPDILILDEATSSVDTRTEQIIQKAMESLMRGRTSFIIAHRLSTVKNADMIFVLRSGDIVEQGTHENLMKQDGFYTKLYNSQFIA